MTKKQVTKRKDKAKQQRNKWVNPSKKLKKQIKQLQSTIYVQKNS